MRARTVIAATLAGVLSLSLVGCNTVKTAFKPPAAKVITREATVAVVGAPVQGKLIKGFPNDIPLWPGAAIDKSRKVAAPNGSAWRAVFVAKDTYDSVLKGIGVGFQKAGWTLASESVGTTESPSDILSATKDRSEVVLTLTKTPTNTTRIEYVITKE